MDNETIIALTADIVAAHVANNKVAIGDMGALVEHVHGALQALEGPVEEQVPAKVPAISVRASIKPDHLACLECGKKHKTLRRHLKVAHGLSPQEYRDAYGLAADYPLTAPDYSKRRSEMAKSIGLGRKKR